MTISHFNKFVYTHGTDEVIRRGKKIHAIGYAELVEYDDMFNSAVFRVKDDNYATVYKVNIQKLHDKEELSVRCSCPYNLGEICRHEVGALFQLQELVDSGRLHNAEKKFDQRHTIAKMNKIDIRTLRMLCSEQTLEQAEDFLRAKKATIESAVDEVVTASVKLDGNIYKVIIKKNDERFFDTSCDYVDPEYPLCLPKIIVFLQLLNAYGAYYFDSIRNWDKEKNKLLALYGYSLNDELGGKFEFSYKDGKPFLRVMDNRITRLNASEVTYNKPMTESFQPLMTTEVVTEVVKEKQGKKLGVVFNFNKKNYPQFTIDVVLGEGKENGKGFVGNVEKLDMSRYVSVDSLSEQDKLQIGLLRKLQELEINKYISRNSPFSGIWENIIHQEEDDLPEETRWLIAEYMLPRLKKIFEGNSESHYVFKLTDSKQFKTTNLEEMLLVPFPILPNFTISRNGKFEVKCFIKIHGKDFSLDENESDSPLFFLKNHQLHLWKNQEVMNLVEKFLPTGMLSISQKEWDNSLRELIIPLTREYDVVFDESLLLEVKAGVPDVKLILSERGDYLVFQAVFSYKGYETKYKDRDEVVVPQGEQVTIVQRDREFEKTFIQKLASLHSGFIFQEETGGLILKGIDVLKNNWFFLFVDSMKEMKVPVFGFEALKNFRFNTTKPTTRIHISSNTDWFDAKVDIFFGDQKVTVAEVKRAIANKQQFVQLGDGTMGILPDDWLKKYSLLFKVGEGKTDNLKLSNYHFSVIDELYENRNEDELMFELEKKYEQLKNFKKIKEIDIPENLNAVLRPYQVAGFHWIHYLSEIGWGGILADDMGLGKTIQALTYLQHIKNKKGKIISLVVCPTTLIYNWENEIKKFTNGLTYQIHHGSNRTRYKEELTKTDIVITTYGTLRSDVKLFVSINFDFTVLDESQAIKNPASKVTKAAVLLNTKQRLCMSGTPLQNNTFDIFAQMNFLNPGMLGSVEYFRQEFSIPIDKFSEQEQKTHLRKILYPFILRRTKEQVAKDLPEKTETILFCEMRKEQRKIYDAYRNEYRSQILGTIESQGIQKSQLTILQGLMKLRQICDSPAIMSEEVKLPNHSIKLEELTREIIENISNHKALIFSQFLGMLALIREKLDELGIKYAYFDGSTSAPNREVAIKSFQEDETVRVFLISLKAGGVGLNLTSADYVYIVDPWWNPAVEQQAIDRTHRIGQTKNIFAYRMICKDTIEDKILTLQERKRALAKDLISDETSFAKSLTREDVEYLFS